MLFERIERHDPQCRFVRSGEPHLRRLPRVERLLPARRAQAPAIARLQPGKSGGRNRDREIVAGRLREREKLGVYLGAYRMHAEILGAGLATAGPVEPGQRLRAAFGKRFAEHIARPGGPPRSGTGSVGHSHLLAESSSLTRAAMAAGGMARLDRIP